MTQRVLNKFPIVHSSEKKIAIIGEAPGADEEQVGEPFIGASGRLLTGMLAKANISRTSCFLGNVYQYRPKNNEIFTVSKESEEWKLSVAQLWEDLILFKPDLIISLGETPLKELTGLSGITKWRGSIINTNHLFVKCKVIPTLHPAFIFRQWKWKPIVELDLVRARKELDFPSPLPARVFKIPMSYGEACCELLELANHKTLAFDIETSPKLDIVCIGFASSAERAVCIPFLNTYSKEETETLWSLVEKLLLNPKINKIAQNAAFDIGVIALRRGIVVKGLMMDTMIAHHSCYAELPKSLAFQTSVYTREPYYKHEGKSQTEDEGEKEWKDTFSREALYRYNCKDCCVTYEIAVKLAHDIQELKCHNAFKIGMDSLEIALFMQFKGILIDKERAEIEQKEIDAKVESLSAIATGLFGREVNVKSPKDMKSLLYDELKLPVQLKDGKPSTDVDALLALARKFRGNDLMVLLKIRQLRTKRAFFSPDVSQDGRLHASFNVVGTETGRWSSSSGILGGRNIMNIPDDECRSIYIPDPGMIFVGFDKAQAEARVVAYKSYLTTHESSYKDLIDSGQKPHVWFGLKLIDNGVFSISKDEFLSRETDAAKTSYYISKVGVHAFSYGMSSQKFPKVIAKETDGLIIVDPKIAKEVKDVLYSVIPSIPSWQLAVEKEISNTLRMYNSFGRLRIFFERLGEDLFGEAYAFEPQSTVGDDLALSLRRIYNEIPECEPLQQNYDSIITQCKESDLEKVIEKMKPLAALPFTMYNFDKSKSLEVSLPVEFKVGKNWKDMKEIKV